MAHVPVVALCTITHNWNQRFEATGKYDRFGNMITRAKGESIAPGTLFEIEDDEELTRLRELDAVRDPSLEELAVWRRAR